MVLTSISSILPTSQRGFSKFWRRRNNRTFRLDGDRSMNVTADRTLLRQAIVNLIHNAVKYSPDRSEVQIRIHRGRK